GNFTSSNFSVGSVLDRVDDFRLESLTFLDEFLDALRVGNFRPWQPFRVSCLTAGFEAEAASIQGRDQRRVLLPNASAAPQCGRQSTFCGSGTANLQGAGSRARRSLRQRGGLS